MPKHPDFGHCGYNGLLSTTRICWGWGKQRGIINKPTTKFYPDEEKGKKGKNLIMKDQ